MASNGQELALVDDVRGLSSELESKKAQMRDLESLLLRKSSEARTVREESALLRELNTINQLTLRKASTQHNPRPTRLRIDDDTVQRILSLEAQIQSETKRYHDLRQTQRYVEGTTQTTEADIKKFSHALSEVVRITGYDVKSSSFTSEVNKFKRMQKILTALEEKQTLARATAQGLTNRIEELTKELDARKYVDEEILKAQIVYEQNAAKLTAMKEDRARFSRISQKKQRLLDHSLASINDAKHVRSLEMDKRTLHHEISRLSEQRKSVDKTIISQSLRIQQLEVQLETIRAFARSVFTDDAEAATFRQDIDEGARMVPVAKVDDMQSQLTVARHTLEARDDALSAIDHELEVLDKKAVVLHQAMGARMANASQLLQGMERDQTVLKTHIEMMQREFEEECEMLVASSEQMRAILRSNGLTPCA